jgi:hypothetical protein
VSSTGPENKRNSALEKSGVANDTEAGVVAEPLEVTPDPTLNLNYFQTFKRHVKTGLGVPLFLSVIRCAPSVPDSNYVVIYHPSFFFPFSFHYSNSRSEISDVDFTLLLGIAEKLLPGSYVNMTGNPAWIEEKLVRTI